MTTEKIYSEGPSFSRILSGAWRWNEVSPQIVDQLFHTSLDEGITSFDHADIYGDHSNEEIFGNVLRENSALRSKIQLVTKCGIKLLSSRRPDTRIKHYDTSEHYIIWSVENSLRNLGTDYMDLLLIHRPDPLLDPEEVSEAFTKLKAAGKVKFFGVSNFTPAQYDMLQRHLTFPMVTNQIELSLLKPQPLFDGTVDFLMKLKTGVMAWSPLGGGNLDKLKDGKIADEVANLKGKYNATESQLLLAWLLRHPAHIFPIIGTTKPERIKESAKAVTIELDRQDWFIMLKWVTGTEVA